MVLSIQIARNPPLPRPSGGGRGILDPPSHTFQSDRITLPGKWVGTTSASAPHFSIRAKLFGAVAHPLHRHTPYADRPACPLPLPAGRRPPARGMAPSSVCRRGRRARLASRPPGGGGGRGATPPTPHPLPPPSLRGWESQPRMDFDDCELCLCPVNLCPVSRPLSCQIEPSPRGSPTVTACPDGGSGRLFRKLSIDILRTHPEDLWG